MAALADGAVGPVEIHCLHVPNAANGWVKAHTLQAIRAGLPARPGDAPGGVRRSQYSRAASSRAARWSALARDSRGDCGPTADPVWDEAELGVVPGLRDLGYRDAYRSLHGYGSREPSWTWQRISGHGGGWRLDHLFTSAELWRAACIYHHAWRHEAERPLGARGRHHSARASGQPRRDSAVRHSPDSLGDVLKRSMVSADVSADSSSCWTLPAPSGDGGPSPYDPRRFGRILGDGSEVLAARDQLLRVGVEDLAGAPEVAASRLDRPSRRVQFERAATTRSSPPAPTATRTGVHCSGWRQGAPPAG